MDNVSGYPLSTAAYPCKKKKNPFLYLWSLLHQLQLKPIWAVTQGPQLANWRQAEI